MRYVGLLVAVAALCAAGCSSGGANCCTNWDFYDPCDLIEGRVDRTCGCGSEAVTPCGPRPCRPGVRTEECYAVPSDGDAASEEVIEEEAVRGSPPSFPPAG